MAVREILLLGNEALYNVSREVTVDMDTRRQVVNNLHDTIVNFRERYGFGRAIAAPQIGEFLRIIYMNIDNKSYALINPRLEFGKEEFQVWDDCMSFPGLEVS
jgi:peptide deformylase